MLIDSNRKQKGGFYSGDGGLILLREPSGRGLRRARLRGDPPTSKEASDTAGRQANCNAKASHHRSSRPTTAALTLAERLAASALISKLTTTLHASTLCNYQFQPPQHIHALANFPDRKCSLSFFRQGATYSLLEFGVCRGSSSMYPPFQGLCIEKDGWLTWNLPAVRQSERTHCSSRSHVLQGLQAPRPSQPRPLRI